MAMDVSYSQAANAYQAQTRMLNQLAEHPEDTLTDTAAASGGGGSFADLLSSVVGNAATSTHKAEHLQLQSLSGKAELSDLVSAITNAELTLDTIVAVRDKIISAYQSIIGMPI